MYNEYRMQRRFSRNDYSGLSEICADYIRVHGATAGKKNKKFTKSGLGYALRAGERVREYIARKVSCSFAKKLFSILAICRSKHRYF